MIKTLSSLLSVFFVFTAVGFAQPFAYITNNEDDTVSVIDTSTNAVVGTVGLGDSPQGVAVTPDGKFVYVGNVISDNVSVIDTSTNTVVDTVGLGDGPAGIAVTPDGSFVYVVNGPNVSVIDTSTNTVVDTVGVGGGRGGIAITPDGRFVYVANFDLDNVSVIRTSTNTVVGTVGVGDGPVAFGMFIGPGLRIVTGIPTLDEWGLIVLTLFIGLSAVWSLRRMNAVKN